MILQEQIKKYGEIHQSDIIQLKKAIATFLDTIYSFALSPVVLCLRLLNSIKDVTIWLIAAVIGLIKLTAQKGYKIVNNGTDYIKNLFLGMTAYLMKDGKNNRPKRRGARRTGTAPSPAKRSSEFNEKPKKLSKEERIAIKDRDLAKYKAQIIKLNEDSAITVNRYEIEARINKIIPRIETLGLAELVTPRTAYEAILRKLNSYTANEGHSFANGAQLRQNLVVALNMLNSSLETTLLEQEGQRAEIGEQTYQAAVLRTKREAIKAMKLGIKLENDAETCSYEDIKTEHNDFMAKVGVAIEMAKTNDINQNDETDSTVSMSSNEGQYEADNRDATTCRMM